MANELNQTEKHRRDLLEDVVDKGLNNFVEVGEALAELRDSKLFRDECATFDEYCRLRFKIDRFYASRLITASEVVKQVESPNVNLGAECCQLATKTQKPAKVKSEAIAREVAKVPKEKRREVWKKAADTAPKDEAGEPKITAAHVRKVVADTPPETVKDETGHTIPAALLPAFASRDEFDRCLNLMRDTIAIFNKLAGDPQGNRAPSAGGEFLARNRQDFLRHMKDARAHISFAKPYTVCPIEHKSGKCPHCGGAGFLTKEHYERVPKELRGAK